MNTNNLEDLLKTIRYPQEHGWYVDEFRKMAWFSCNVVDYIDHDEVLEQALGKLYAFNLSRYVLGHSQEEPPVQTLRNSRYVWSVRAYIHGGISLAPSYSANYQHYDRWDSGQVGYHIVTLADVYKWMSKSRWNKMSKSEQDRWVMEQVREWYETYNSWLNGDVQAIALYRLTDDIYSRYEKYGTEVLIQRELSELGLEVDSLWFYGNQWKEAQEWMDELIAKIDAEISQVGE